MKHWTQITGLAAAVVILSAGLGFAQEQTAGLVRISDKPAVGNQMKAQARKAGQQVSYAKPGECDTGNCNDGGCQDGSCQDCQECRGIPCLPCLLGLPCLFHGHNCYGSHGSLGAGVDRYRANNPHGDNFDPYNCYYDENGKLVCDDPNSFKAWRKKAACRYGYFRPQGNCGKGLATFGRYKHVISLNPDYFDPRDGKLYAAQGYGTNISVPLAPTVGSVYNYGWGIPSSRQTYVSHRIPLPVQQVQPTPDPASAPLPAVR